MPLEVSKSLILSGHPSPPPSMLARHMKDSEQLVQPLSKHFMAMPLPTPMEGGY